MVFLIEPLAMSQVFSSQVSSWPLNPSSRRFVLPQFAIEQLAAHALSRDLYPHAFGYYEAAGGHAMRRTLEEHADHLLMYCVQGEGLLRVDGGEWRILPGSVVLLPAGVGHSYAAEAGRPWSVFFAHFSGAQTAAFCEPLLRGESLAVCRLGVHPQLLNDWQALLEARPAGFEMTGLLVAANRLRQILVGFAQLAQAGSTHRSRLDVAAIQSHMQAHLQESPTLESLARLAGMEKFHFAKTFRKLTGHSPLQHFLHLRMARACELLDSGEGGVADVANELGYADAHYFSRQFRQVIGLSPTAYRSLKRG